MSRDLYSSTFDQKNEQKMGEIYQTWVILVKFYICIYVYMMILYDKSSYKLYNIYLAPGTSAIVPFLGDGEFK